MLKIIVPTIAASLLLASGGAAWARQGVVAPAASSACDRPCMEGLTITLLKSIAAHRPQDVPLTEYYRATDNGVPAAVAFMDLWRTISTAGAHELYIDPVSHQVFFIASVAEGSVNSLLWGRAKIEGRKFSELELYLTRSRGDAGFIFGDGKLDQFSAVWTQPVAGSRIPSREELLRIGKAMFTPSMPIPPAGPGCTLMENGGIVEEEAEWMAYNHSDGGAGMPPPTPAAGASAHSPPMMGCPLPPGRPGDPEARVDVVDTERGVVVSIASLEGLIFNYPVTDPTWSAFVPNALLGMHEAALTKALATGKYRQPKVVTMPASILVGQIFRVYDGKVQGFHMVQKLGPTGARSPWTLPTVDAPGNGK